MEDRPRHSNRRTVLKTVGGLSTAGLLAGCSGGKQQSADGSSGDSSGSSGGSGDESTATPSLKERAKQEGTAAIALSTSGSKEFFNSFQEDTGIKANTLRTDSGKIVTRISQEASAGKLSFDIVQSGSTQAMFDLVERDVFGEYPPVALERTPAVESENGVTAFSFAYKGLTLLYNENVVSSPPTSLDELFTDEWKGKVTVDVRDSELLLAAEQALGSKAKAEEFVTNLGDVATWRSSHFDAAKQCAREEVPMSVTYAKYQYYDWGGPLAEAPIEAFPKTAQPTYNGLTKEPPHPAAGKFLLKRINEKMIDFYKRTQGESLYFTPKDVKDSGLWYLELEAANEVDWESLDEQYKNLADISK